MTERLVVIGGDAAGMSAASRARRGDDDLEIVVLERGTHTSYSACGIPYYVSGAVDDLDDLVVRTPRQHRERFRLDVRIRQEVVGIDVSAREVAVRDLERGRDLRLGFDHLLVATGARAIRPDLPGIDAPFVRGVTTLDDAEALLTSASSEHVERVAVVGAGYIGLEMAEAFRHWGADVTLFSAGPRPMPTIDPDMAEPIVEALERYDIDAHYATPVTGFEDGHVLTHDGSYPADLVVLGIGVRPNSDLAVDAGIPVGVKDAIRVDRRQQSEREGIWAAGDVCESRHLVSGEPIHIALGTVANRQGRVAGINLGGGYATFPGAMCTAATRICSLEIARTGLTSAEAEAAGFSFEAVTIESSTRAGYLSSARPIRVRLLVEQLSGRVLGGQIVGEEGSAKRIDVVATAIAAGLSVDELTEAELAYAPPFGPLWDPVTVAARRGARVIRRGPQ